MSHAYYVTGEQEAAVEEALRFIEKEHGLPTAGNPDVSVMRYGMLSVEDARTLSDFARQAPVSGGKRALVIATGRFFHEAQNALLKLFEEPPEGTFLILVLPTEGLILPTLRSRMIPLPEAARRSEIAVRFLQAKGAEREEIIEKLLERTKSDKEDEKQAARGEAVALAEGLVSAAYEASKKKPSQELTLFLKEMDTFLPMLHDRAAPLKLIFEHVRLVLPADLVR